MPLFDAEHVLRILTPETLSLSVCGGLILGWFLLVTAPDRRLSMMCLLHASVPGTAFLAAMAVARFINRPHEWETWFGILGLWLLYVAVGTVSALLWQRSHD